MPFINGGGGGAAFDGGTISQPLTVYVTAPAAGSDLLTVHSGAGTGSFPLRVLRTPGGANAITVGSTGFNGDVKFWADWDNDNDPTLEIAGTAGVIKMKGLPASDPGSSGQLYTVAGILHVSP